MAISKEVALVTMSHEDLFRIMIKEHFASLFLFLGNFGGNIYPHFAALVSKQIRILTIQNFFEELVEKLLTREKREI